MLAHSLSVFVSTCLLAGSSCDHYLLLLLVAITVMQSRDNVKFLATLERHFRAIASGPLLGILDTLAPLLNALRMIWVISRTYSDDGCMGALLARIATELCDRVEGSLALQTLFRMPACDAVELLRISKATLDSWQTTYMQVSRNCHANSMCNKCQRASS